MAGPIGSGKTFIFEAVAAELRGDDDPALDEQAVQRADVHLLSHATTVVTNAILEEKGADAALVFSSDSVAWLLNIRGSDIARNPVAHGFAILRDDARVELFMRRQPGH